MGYYCTVPQCTSLAGKTKNVKFHRFPRDVPMANKWNVILKRGKPYTKYSKVCSLHFTQADYNITTMGQWKTLNKDAVPSQNLPKTHPDGTVMVIRKSRTVKYKSNATTVKREDEQLSDKMSAWPLRICALEQDLPAVDNAQVSNSVEDKPQKQDAFMQTDPDLTKEPYDTDDPNNTSSETSQHSYKSEQQYSFTKEQDQMESDIAPKKDKYYAKLASEEYLAHSSEGYQRPVETYSESKPNFEQNATDYQKPENYEKMAESYSKPRSVQPIYQKILPDQFPQEGYDKGSIESSRQDISPYQYPCVNAADLLRNQQHNLQMLQMHHTGNENQNFFTDNPIKQEINLTAGDDKNMYSQSEPENSNYFEAQVKTEPDSNTGIYYGSNDLVRPGPELLIAKQKALAAHTQLWQNSMKRPFFYSESPHYNTMFLPRSEDLARILNQ